MSGKPQPKSKLGRQRTQREFVKIRKLLYELQMTLPHKGPQRKPEPLTKRCTKCKAMKPIDLFGKIGAARQYRRSECNHCRRLAFDKLLQKGFFNDKKTQVS